MIVKVSKACYYMWHAFFLSMHQTYHLHIQRKSYRDIDRKCDCQSHWYIYPCSCFGNGNFHGGGHCNIGCACAKNCKHELIRNVLRDESAQPCNDASIDEWENTCQDKGKYSIGKEFLDFPTTNQSHIEQKDGQKSLE